MVKKKSLSVSPLGATIILVLLSIIVGAFAISIGESFIEENAEFTRSGAEEVRAGCSAVSLEVTKVSGITVACIKKNKNIVDISLDNGPDIDLSDLHIKLLGSQSVKNFQTSLKEPLKRLVLAGKIAEKDFELVKDDIIAATRAEKLEYIKLKADSKIDFEHEIEV